MSLMLQEAGVSDEQLHKLKMSGLVHEGKLADTAKLSKYDIVGLCDNEELIICWYRQ